MSKPLEPAQAKIIATNSSFRLSQETQRCRGIRVWGCRGRSVYFIHDALQLLPVHRSQVTRNQGEYKDENFALTEEKAKKKVFCSNQSLETLTTQFLQDLPSYANRASQRARRLNRMTDVFSYMVVAGRPEFERLPLNPGEYNRDTLTTVSEGVEQVFFTTLERQYTVGKAIELQLFHWLFLTRTESGWQFVMMFSQIGSYPKKQPPTPPQESSNGVVAQGIKAWLRDCRAGSLRSASFDS